MITINDIAEKAGVAKSTVSRYLNGGSISQKTADKIRKIIKETDYVPNHFAQSLKAKNSHMIGAIIPRLDSYAASRILSGLETRLKERGYRLTIVNSNLEQAREIEALQHFQVTKMDGVVFMMTQFSEAIQDTIRGLQLPVVAVGQESPLSDSIYFNEAKAGRLMADFLYQQGHRHLHFLAVTEDDPAVGRHRKYSLKERFLSYPGTTWQESMTGFRLDEAHQVTVDHILKTDTKLIVGATDMLAIGAMRACLEAGLRVPQDMSIAGFGNHATGTAFYPRLTTIDYPYYQAGVMAADHVINRVQSGKIEANIQMTTSLVVRESVLDLNQQSK